MRYARWVQPPGAEPRLWLAVATDSAVDDQVCLELLSLAGEVIERLVVPVGGRHRSVSLALRADARPVAVGVRAGGSAVTFRVGRGGAVSPAVGRELLDADSGGSRFLTVGRSGGGESTDVRWHGGGADAVVVSCAGLPGSEEMHVRPYLSGSTGGFLDEGVLLLGLEDDYDEGDVEVFGAERWRPWSHWLVVSGRPRGVIAYPDPGQVGDLAVPLGDGTRLTHGRDALHRWSVGR